MKRIRLKHYRGIDPQYSFCAIVSPGPGAIPRGISHGIYFKRGRSISKEEFDEMTTNLLKGKESWASKDTSG